MNNESSIKKKRNNKIRIATTYSINSTLNLISRRANFAHIYYILNFMH